MEEFGDVNDFMGLSVNLSKHENRGGGVRKIVIWLLITKNEATEDDKLGHQVREKFNIDIHLMSCSSQNQNWILHVQQTDFQSFFLYNNLYSSFEKTKPCV